jgi:hypothetical protein
VKTKRLRLALAVSLALHLVALLCLRARPIVPPTAVAQREPIELEIRETVAPPPQPPRAAPTVPPPPVTPARPKPSTRPAAAAASPAVPRDFDAEPPRVTLTPRDDVVSLPPGMPAEGSRGHTLHNVPSELPDPAAVLAERAERGRVRVQGFAEDELAEARVHGGIVSGYFRALGRELSAGLEHPPEIFTPGAKPDDRLMEWASQLARSSEGAWQRYGATGAPYAEPEGYRAELEVPSKLAEAAQNGEPFAMVAAARMHETARLLEWADGRAGIDLVAVVELRQDADGTLRHATLVQPSGVRPFDAWVLRNAELSVDALKEPPPDAGPGIHANGLRSVWELRGRVSYMRSTRDFDAKQDAWYLLLMAPLGAAPGRFDEVTRTATYVDLRYPHYEATAKLLRVY